MTHDTTDPRPRRRLFGRRRSDGHESPTNEPDAAREDGPVTRDEVPSPGEFTPPTSSSEPSTTDSGTDGTVAPGPVEAEATGGGAELVEPPPTAPAEPIAASESEQPVVPPVADETEVGQVAGAGETELGQVTGPDEEEEPMVTTNPSVSAVDEAAVDSEGTETAAHEEETAADVPAAPEPQPVPADDPGGPLPLPRVIAIANQKGGVGKTTTAVNLGAALAEAGYRVLVVDLDPQGNASTGLGISPRDVENSVYDVIMTDTPALDCVEPTSLKNLFVLPATIDLAGAEIELVAAFSRELKLRRALDPVRSEYDIILIDCPPSLGLLTVNGLAAADDVIVPVQSEYYALEGLGQLLKNVAMVRSVNPTLDVRGIVLTMHDARTKLAEQVELEVREHFGAKVYKTAVPRNVRLAEAPSFGQPIIAFDPASRGAWAYRDLAKEVTGGATGRTR